MDDLFTSIDNWKENNIPMALATVISTWGSSPRGVGSKMVVNVDGDMAGSVSGGCVESAVVEAGMAVCKNSQCIRLEFGVSDEVAWDVGLACGGQIEVFVQPLNIGVFHSLKSRWEEDIPTLRAFAIQGPNDILGKELILSDGGGFFPSQVEDNVISIEQLGREVLEAGVSRREWISASNDEKIEVFLDYIQPTGTIIIVGGVHIAVHLVRFAKEIGFRIVVIDPRKKFSTPERFPYADQIYQTWPKSALSEISLTSLSAVVILTHDPKIDDQALEIVLDSNAFYIGALGSPKTQFARRSRLLEQGFHEDALSRIRGPIGLDLGSQSPAEIALGILAEIVQYKNKNNEERKKV